MTQHNPAIDALRGLGILGMIVVSFTNLESPLWPAIQADPYIGCNAADFIAPLFLFAVGCSMAYSFSTLRTSAAILKKLTKRCAIILSIGAFFIALSFLSVYEHDPEYSGLHQFADFCLEPYEYEPLIRIAFCMLAGGVIIAYLRNYIPILLLIIPLGILHNYTLIWLIDAELVNYDSLRHFPHTHTLHRDAIEIHNYSSHMTQLQAQSIITSTIPLLFGYASARSIIESNSITKFIIFASFITAIFYTINLFFNKSVPIISSLWTSSYALHASLMCLVLFLIFCIMSHIRLGLLLSPICAIGYNPLIFYIIYELISRFANKILAWTGWWPEMNIHSYYYQEVCYFYARQNEILASIFYTSTLVALVVIPSFILYALKKRFCF